MNYLFDLFKQVTAADVMFVQIGIILFILISFIICWILEKHQILPSNTDYICKENKKQEIEADMQRQRIIEEVAREFTKQYCETRYTTYIQGYAVIKDINLLQDAILKLARFEDAIELKKIEKESD